MRMKKWLLRIAKVLAFLVCLIAVMQLVPYGRSHTNPPVVGEPKWDSPRTRELAQRACFDCHSNETKWPWYSHVAPLSWVVQRDVDIGRTVINFSEWPVRDYEIAHEAGTSVIRGDMPLLKYRWLHPEARLTDDELVELARGLSATFGVRSKI